MDLFLGLAFGVLGMSYFVYGKKTSQFLFMLTGLLLCTYSYITPGIPAIVGVGLLLAAVPFIAQRLSE